MVVGRLQVRDRLVGPPEGRAFHPDVLRDLGSSTPSAGGLQRGTTKTLSGGKALCFSASASTVLCSVYKPQPHSRSAVQTRPRSFTTQLPPCFSAALCSSDPLGCPRT